MTTKSTVSMSLPMEMLVYLLKMRATMSVPPVVPPALKMMPSPIPKTIPVPRQASKTSPSRAERK